MEKKEEEEQITPEEIQFFNIMAMSNFGSFILIVSDQCIQALMTILAVFHNTTENDVIIHTHVHEYSHLEYLQLLRTLNSNPPIDLSTHIIRGENVLTDLQIYDNDLFDVMILYNKQIISISSIIPLFWNKLKYNGTLIIKGIDHQDKNKLFELQVLFGNVIKIPPNIKINIHLIENTKNVIIIKKPCY